MEYLDVTLQYYTPTKFDQNSLKTFWALMLTNRKNDMHAHKHHQKHNLFGRGNNVCSMRHTNKSSQAAKRTAEWKLWDHFKNVLHYQANLEITYKSEELETFQRKLWDVQRKRHILHFSLCRSNDADCLNTCVAKVRFQWSASSHWSDVCSTK